MAKQQSPELSPNWPGRDSLITRRRLMLSGAALSGLLGACVGGRLLTQWSSRQRRAKALVGAATALLASSKDSQLLSLPKQSADEINRFFAGVCLNVHRFTDEIGSSNYVATLRRCPTDEDRKQLLATTFSSVVASELKMQGAVEQVIDQTASQIDQEWQEVCAKIEQTWGLCGISFGQSARPANLRERLDIYISQEIRRVQALSSHVAEKLTLTDTGIKITRAAVALLPMARFGIKVYLPLFVVASLAAFLEFTLDQLSHRQVEYRKAISRQLSQLSLQIADQCERAFREQIAQLHQWQKAAVDRMSYEIASDEIPLVLWERGR